MLEQNAAERRRSPRASAFFPIRIDTDDRAARLGVVRNASAVGILFNTPSRFEPGDELTVTMEVKGLESERAAVPARVVRVEKVDWASPLPWRYLIAVQFHEPIEQLYDVLLERPTPSLLH